VLLTVVTSEEGDVSDAINRVRNQNIEKLEEWFGMSRGREMEIGILQINLIIHDRLDSTSNQEVNLIDGDLAPVNNSLKPPLDEET
jgi:hypothetical protein